MTFAAKTAPTDDVRVRKAIVHAIDRQAIVQDVLYGLAVAGEQPDPAEHRRGPGRSKLKGFAHDPQLSAALLDQAGWRQERHRSGRRTASRWPSRCA